MSTSVDKFVVSLVINSVIGAASLILFCILRTRVKWLYEPRVQSKSVSAPNASGLLAWLKSLFQYSDADMLRICGVDALVNLKFLAFCLKLFAVASLYGFIVLVPINATGNNIDVGSSGNSTLDGFDLLSMSNIPTGSPRIIAHFLAAFLISVFAYYLLYQNCQQYLQLRVQYLLTKQPSNFSILVQDIPKSQATESAVVEHFQALYHDDRCCAVLLHDFQKLERYHKERKQAYRHLEHSLAILEQRRKQSQDKQQDQTASLLHSGPAHVDRPAECVKCRRVDAVRYWSDRLDELNSNVSEELQRTHSALPTAFVTFSRRSLVYEACRPQAYDSVAQSWAWRAHRVAEPRDVLFRNLYHSSDHQAARWTCVWIVTMVLILFYVVPVAFATWLVNLDELEKLLPFLTPVLELSPTIKGFIQGYLPTVIVYLFMILLPMVLWLLTRRQGLVAKSEEQLSMLSKLFLFQLVNVFFTAIVASSILNALQAIFEDPQNLISLLGVSVPNTGIFFTTYVMLQACLSPLDLLQVGKLLTGCIGRRRAKTDWERSHASAPEPYNYGLWLPYQLLVFVIGITYAVIAPIVLPFVVLFYAAYIVVLRQRSLYVFTQRFETGGRFWPAVFTRIMVGLFLAQGTFMAAIAIKLGDRAMISLVIAPLLVITLGFAIYLSHNFLREEAVYKRLRAVEQVDRLEKEDVHSLNQEYAHPLRQITPVIRVKDSLAKGATDARIQTESSDDHTLP
eukprot:TRINITY_DN589_c0_g2_i1.p1 TRINITY_DN589_c0_g2~~TRINITY_DN589_c0_g2_i1.p1  ORF type:complete len:737 (-),score=128.55 TRINITY_DN589_c0_g2_i1:557-2767(-)